MRYNDKVRAEHGGAAAARAKTDVLKRAPGPCVGRYCDSLLREPMPDATFEALARVMEFRAGRHVPEHDVYYLPPPRPRGDYPWLPPLRRRQRGARWSHKNGWWARCETCRRYVASDGTCRQCNSAKETATYGA